MQRLHPSQRKSERGMSLAETLLALVVFTVIFLAALALYSSASRAYQQTDAATVQQQNARFALDRMSETIRDAGANYNPLGKSAVADEQVEGAWESAIFVRGDYDGSTENTQTSTQFPMVTTGNDEIVGYVLQKDGGGAYTLSLKMDLTPAVRDAESAAAPTDEETATVRVAARTLAEQTDPPYDLTRVTFDSAGAPQYQVIATNVFRLSFTYQNTTGTTIIGTGGAAYGAADAERDERDDIRKIGIDLITMADRPDLGYSDTHTYTPAESAATKKYRKFELAKNILSVSLGLKGSRHFTTPSEAILAPPRLQVCVGHNFYYYLNWDASPTTGITDYKIQITAAAPPISLTEDAIGTTSKVWKQTEPTPQVYTFKVQGMAGSSLGDWSASAQMTTWHDTTNSRPNPPTSVAAVAGGGNNLAVTWPDVTTNFQAVTSGTACIQVGSSPGPSAPTSPWNTAAPDLKEYHVYRVRYPIAANGTFSPTDPGNRVEGAAYSYGGLTNTTPTVASFIDNTAAPCGKYFYRVRAYDSAGLTAPALESPPMAQPAFYIPRPGVTPATPGPPSPIGSVTTGPGTISVRLQWNDVNRDSTGRPAATVHYQLVRQVSRNGGAYQNDGSPTDFYEQTSMPGAINLPTVNSGDALTYRFAVLALYDCNDVGDSTRTTAIPPEGSSNWYYLTCTFVPSITPSGQSSGDGSFANPWVMDQGDTVTVGVAGTVSSVRFTLREEGTNAIVDGPVNDSTAPFQYSYSNQIDNVLYRLEIIASSPSGCNYNNNFWISDAPPIPPCLFGTTVVSNPATHTVESGGNGCAASTPAGSGGQGANKTRTSEWTYTIPNTSPTDDLTLKQIKVDWAPDANHGDAQLSVITFPASGGGTVTLGPGANTPPTTNLVNVPATTAIVTRSTTNYTIRIKFTYNKCDLFMADSPPPISKICLVYRSPSTGTQDRFCNLVGTGTNNPTSCN